MRMPKTPKRPDVAAIKAMFEGLQAHPTPMRRYEFCKYYFPALIAHIEALEKEREKLVEATKVAVAMCLCCDGTGEARTLGDETEVGQASGSSAIPCPNCTEWREILAALDGDGDG